MSESIKPFVTPRNPKVIDAILQAEPHSGMPLSKNILTGEVVYNEPTLRLKFPDIDAAAAFVNQGLEGSGDLHIPVTPEILAATGTATTGGNAEYDVYITSAEDGETAMLVRHFGRQPLSDHLKLSRFGVHVIARITDDSE